MKAQIVSKRKPSMTRAPVLLLEKLSNAIGVSGNEEEIRRIVIDQIKSYVDEYKVDSLGNLLAVKHALTPGALRVMFAAHMDEVGFMLVEEDGDGLYAFEKVGSID